MFYREYICYIETVYLRPAVVASEAGKTGPGQTRPRQGTTGKPAKPKQFSVSIQQIYSLHIAYIQV